MIFYQKQKWPRAISFLIFSWSQIWIACDILRKSSAGSRRWSFWQTTTFFSLCFQPLPDGTFFPKTMLAFPFFSYQWDHQNTFLFFFVKKARQNPNDWVCFYNRYSETVVHLYINIYTTNCYYYITITSQFSSTFLRIPTCVFSGSDLKLLFMFGFMLFIRLLIAKL